MAYDVGDIALFTLTVAPFDGTTEATVVVKSPSGAEAPGTPTELDGGATWTLQVPLTEAGAWYVGWTVTGTGAGAQWDSAVAELAPPPTAEQESVRLLISDTDPANRFYSTREIDLFLTMSGNSHLRAAAQALDTMASNEAMVSKKLRTQDLQTDGPAVAKELRERAAELRRQADAGEGDEEASGFEIAEFEPYPCRTPWGY